MSYEDEINKKFEVWKIQRDAQLRADDAARQDRQMKARAALEAKCADPKHQTRLKAYLEELVAVGKKHGLTLGHEDGQGAFQVSERSDGDYDEWLLAAYWSR